MCDLIVSVPDHCLSWNGFPQYLWPHSFPLCQKYRLTQVKQERLIVYTFLGFCFGSMFGNTLLRPMPVSIFKEIYTQIFKGGRDF